MKNIEVKETTITNRNIRRKIIIPPINNDIKINIGLYIFPEGRNYYSIYCPSLHLVTGGKTHDEALKAFDEVFQIHVEYCVEHKTLLEDLIENCDWKITDKTVKVPDIEEMIIKDDILRDIFRKKKYQKVTKTVSIPIYS
jgi:predicted RNase H-like HicB family nuclease